MTIGSVSYGNMAIYQTRQDGGIYAAGQRKGFDAASLSKSGGAGQNASFGEILARNARADMSETQLEQQALQEKRAEQQSGVPYSFLAKDGIIEYEGVIFVCDEEHNALCLGDMSNPDDCIRIPLSGGGCLIVNRDNIGDLAKAIGMFSPEDVKLILQAIAQDAKIQQMKNEIDEETSGIGLARDIEEAQTEAEAPQTKTGALEFEGTDGKEENPEENMSRQELSMAEMLSIQKEKREES